MIRCHKCGYSNQHDVKNCIKCRSSLEGNEAVVPDAADPASPNRKTVVMSMSDQTPWTQERAMPPMHRNRPVDKSSSQTVRRVVPDAKSCYLVAVSPDDDKELRTIDVKGDNILLDRSILDPANNSISRSGHASIYQKSGKWFLDNRTAMKTTFIRVDQPIELSEGDMLLMGDSLFKFKMGKLDPEGTSGE